VKGIIFDWGGVIMRTEDRSHRFAWDDRLGAAHGTVERIVHGIPEWNQLQHGTITHDEYQMAVARHLTLTTEDVTQLLSDFYKGDTLNAEAITLIKWLHPQPDIRTGLMSNNILALRAEIDELGLSAYFETIAISAEIGIMKPHSRAYLTAVEGLHLTPEQCLFIDDTAINIEGAEAAGLHALHFTDDLDLSATVKDWLTS
jgi:putative hydrolase of the HAD superfamily